MSLPSTDPVIVNASNIDMLQQQVAQLSAEVAELREQIQQHQIEAVCCPDCGAFPCAVKQNDLLLVHCGVCGPDNASGLCLAILDARKPWQASWNRLVSEEMAKRAKEQL